MGWIAGVAWRTALFGSTWKIVMWGLAVGLVLLKMYGLKEQKKGVEKERARVETQAKKDVQKASKARAQSADPAARGVRDPHARD